MTLPRTYSVQEIKQLVDVLRHNSDMQPEQLAGMDELVRLLRHYEYMSDEDIERETVNDMRTTSK